MNANSFRVVELEKENLHLIELNKIMLKALAAAQKIMEDVQPSLVGSKFTKMELVLQKWVAMEEKNMKESPYASPTIPNLVKESKDALGDL